MSDTKLYTFRLAETTLPDTTDSFRFLITETGRKIRVTKVIFDYTPHRVHGLDVEVIPRAEQTLLSTFLQLGITAGGQTPLGNAVVPAAVLGSFTQETCIIHTPGEYNFTSLYFDNELDMAFVVNNYDIINSVQMFTQVTIEAEII